MSVGPSMTIEVDELFRDGNKLCRIVGIFIIFGGKSKLIGSVYGILVWLLKLAGDVITEWSMETSVCVPLPNVSFTVISSIVRP